MYCISYLRLILSFDFKEVIKCLLWGAMVSVSVHLHRAIYESNLFTSIFEAKALSVIDDYKGVSSVLRLVLSGNYLAVGRTVSKVVVYTLDAHALLESVFHRPFVEGESVIEPLIAERYTSATIVSVMRGLLAIASLFDAIVDAPYRVSLPFCGVGIDC